MEDDFDFISLAALTANVVRWLELGAVVQAGAVEAPSDKSRVDEKPSSKPAE
jgi:hypothetical protein